MQRLDYVVLPNIWCPFSSVKFQVNSDYVRGRNYTSQRSAWLCLRALKSVRSVCDTTERHSQRLQASVRPQVLEYTFGKRRQSVESQIPVDSDWKKGNTSQIGIAGINRLSVASATGGILNAFVDSN